MNKSDQILLRIMDHIITNGHVKNESAFGQRIGMERSNLSAVRGGRRSFTIEQIRMACKEFGLNANCILNLETNIYRNQEHPKFEAILQQGPSDKKVTGGKEKKF